jgi:FkbH-like protein
MLDWLPAPRDFALALRAAQTAEPAARFAQLAALSRQRLDFLETLQLDRALQALAPADRRLPQLRLAILSDATTEQLLPGIRVAGVRHGIALEVRSGGYGQYRQEVLDAGSSLYGFAPRAVLFSLTAAAALAPIPLTASAAEVEGLVGAFTSELAALWRAVRERLGASVIQQTFLDVGEPLFGGFERQVPAAPATLVATLNERVAQAARTEGVALLDTAQASARDGRDAWFDVARWLQAKQEIAPGAASAYGELLARIVAAQLGLSKKCLVLDLDDTLWGGAVGDVGPQGIVLGPGSAPGEAHAALQRYAAALRARGVILAVCSKNDESVAAETVASHPEMSLRPADFAAFVANWNDKSDNLRGIAAQLGIGLDSLVFVDDNPVERARVREVLPEVAVPELPADVAGYVRCLAAAGYFEAVSFTADDQRRAQQYRANAERDSLRVAAPSMEEFLRDLDMKVEYGPFAEVDLARVTQLINKTNQFNLTNRRHSSEQVAQLRVSPRALALQFRLADRFGDNGLVSVMIFLPSPSEEGTLELDTWVMSCRVFGRRLEHEAMNIAVEEARQRGVRTLIAEFVPSARNAQFRGLYAELGFTPAAADASAAGAASRWRLALADYVPRPGSIARVRP